MARKIREKDFVFTLRGGMKMPALGLGTYAPKEVNQQLPHVMMYITMNFSPSTCIKTCNVILSYFSIW